MRHRRTPWWVDWVAIGKRLLTSVLLVAACAAATWLAIHGEPGHT
ncbi:hypothetical protein [Streptomyces syringium]